MVEGRLWVSYAPATTEDAQRGYLATWTPAGGIKNWFEATTVAGLIHALWRTGLSANTIRATCRNAREAASGSSRTQIARAENVRIFLGAERPKA